MMNKIINCFKYPLTVSFIHCRCHLDRLIRSFTSATNCRSLIFSQLMIIIIILSVSCSSAPRHTPSPMVSEADNLYQLGKELSLQGYYDYALKSYQLALERYSLVDHVAGIILSRIAIIGVDVHRDNVSHINQELDSLSNLIKLTAPNYKQNLQLLKAEIAFVKKDYDQIIELTDNISATNLIIESQLLCYRLMALVKIDQPAKQEYRALRNHANSLYRAHRRNRADNLSVYSYVNYVMGYYLATQLEWEKAIDYFQISLVIDRDNDNSRGIAKNLYYLGKSHENINNFKLAITYYKRALNVFDLLGDTQRTNEISAKIYFLKEITNEFQLLLVY